MREGEWCKQLTLIVSLVISRNAQVWKDEGFQARTGYIFMADYWICCYRPLRWSVYDCEQVVICNNRESGRSKFWIRDVIYHMTAERYVPISVFSSYFRIILGHKYHEPLSLLK